MLTGKILTAESVKFASRLFAVLLGLPFAAVVAFGQSQPARCTLKLEQLPEVRGLRIGMTTQELFSHHPRLKDQLKTVDVNGLARAEGVTGRALNESLSTGVSLIYLTVFDDKLVKFEIDYDDSVKWPNISEYRHAVESNLKLPTAVHWKTGGEDGEDDEAILECADGSISITPVPTLTLELRDSDLRISQTLLARAKRHEEDLKQFARNGPPVPPTANGSELSLEGKLRAADGSLTTTVLADRRVILFDTDPVVVLKEARLSPYGLPSAIDDDGSLLSLFLEADSKRLELLATKGGFESANIEGLRDFYFKSLEALKPHMIQIAEGDARGVVKFHLSAGTYYALTAAAEPYLGLWDLTVTTQSSPTVVVLDDNNVIPLLRDPTYRSKILEERQQRADEEKKRRAFKP
jgi:hypothetical protein